MKIIDSRVIEVSPQIDGRRYVREAHTDESGTVHHVLWLAQPKQNTDEFLAQRAVMLEQSITQDMEREANILLGEKARATELLKLTDDVIQKILMVDSVELSVAKDELTEKQAYTDTEESASKG